MDNLEIVSAILILIIIYLLLQDKRRGKKLVKAKMDEGKIVRVFQDIDATPEDVYQSISSLAKLAQQFPRPRPDLINLLLNIMNKNNTNTLIQQQALKCLNSLNNKLHPTTHNKLRQRIIDAALNAMEKFSTDAKTQKKCLALLWGIKEVAFDKWHCLKLLLNTLSILETETETLNSLRVCDSIFYSIPVDQRDIYADVSDNWKQTWVCKWHEDGELRTMRKTLAVLWNICSLPSKQDETISFDLQFFTDALETFKDDPVTKEGILGVLHNISCKKQFCHCFLTPELLPQFRDDFLSGEFRVSFAASKVIVKLLYHVAQPWPETGVKRTDLLAELKKKLTSGWEVTDVEVLRKSSIQFNCVELLQSGVEELELYSVWFVRNLCGVEEVEEKLEKCGVKEIVTKRAQMDDAVGDFCKEVVSVMGGDI